ncbi:GNAT family N-acetyltransferase [Nigerium massiliense]|uniref:GNAT family N-acetyltransferase n=1 Tax=Nigerium massiliense TaxID=1522317 RepID=UPI00058B4EC6|nr:GNAT family N-acetyltransferase [Nigerium massiliense]
MAPRIRQATGLDLEAMARMKNAAWRESYPGLVPDDILASLDDRVDGTVALWREQLLNGVYLWVVTDGDDVVGLSQALPGEDDDIDIPLELTMMYLLDRVKGTDLSRALLWTTIGDADAYLWVLADNTRAQAFYAKHGFVADGARRVSARSRAEQIRMARRSE